jgi:ubiquinone/menaquinone biosynthesis C-methylase UbiE
MSVTPSPAAGAGYGDEWNSSWSSLGNDMVQLYTKGRPRNIHEFWQRCYFEDLWMSMGERAAEAKYIELGAGRGTTSMYLASKGCDVTMLDLSSAGFEVAARNFEREGLRAPTFIHADARDTQLSSDSFDCVFNIGLLEHFERPQDVLTESVRLLKPGGLQFAVIMPERPPSMRFLTLGLMRPWALIRELMPDNARAKFRKMRGHEADHPRSRVLRTTYSRADYLAMLRNLPVGDASCVPYNPYHPVYKSVVCEAAIAIPLYKAHRSLRRVFAIDPRMKTPSSLASCDLLTFRKLA